jgi:hypothetical protein
MERGESMKKGRKEGERERRMKRQKEGEKKQLKERNTYHFLELIETQLTLPISAAITEKSKTG